MTLAYIGLGSNLENPETQISNALQALSELPSTTFVSRSSIYLSEPQGGPPGQPRFYNAVALIDTTLAPLTLLDNMQRIERRQGRRRDGVRWGPRTIDLDLLLYGRQQLDMARLIVPHPEIPRRNFVLSPLAEITHDLYIPGLGPVTDLLAAAGTEGLEKLSINE